MPCYNSAFQQLAADREGLGKVLSRVVGLVLAVLLILALTACGGGNGTTTVTTPNGNTISNPSGTLKNRAYISNQYSGNLQIVDSANDSTAFYSSNNTNTSTTNQIVDLSVHIAVGNSSTFLRVSPDATSTAVYDPSTDEMHFVANSSQTDAAQVPLPAWAAMALYSTDSKKLYVPTGNAVVLGSGPGAIQVIDIANADISASYNVPSVRWIALSPNGNTMLAFADNSDSMWFIDLTQTTITPVAIPGFARPVNAFFSSDNNTAYVLNCGPQCGTNSPPSVAQFDIPSKTIKTSVVVGGASVGLLSGNNLYVAGYPGGANGTFDIVDVSSMTRTTANSVLINDGQQSKMALNNNMLYIGAQTCSNSTTGCLSIVNLSGNTAVTPGPPLGAVTGMLSVPNRNVMYVIQGGVLNIYDAQTNQQMPSLRFRGALYDVVQVDQ
jgi:hypothetical protein